MMMLIVTINGDDDYCVKIGDGDDVSGEQSLVRNDPVIESGLSCPMMTRSSFSALHCPQGPGLQYAVQCAEQTYPL